MKMELEELMTNRALLEQMSQDEIHTMYNRKQPNKHVIIQENHSKPKEVRIEYKASSHVNGYKVENSINQATTQNKQDQVVLEGYGCKCPKKLKRVLKILWVLLLLLYIFGMPVVLLHFNSKLSNVKARITELEDDLNSHLTLFKSMPEVKSSKVSRPKGGSSKTSNEIPVHDMEINYKSLTTFEIRMNKTLDLIDEELRQYNQRIQFVRNVETWVRKTVLENNKSGKCICLNNSDLLDWLDSVTPRKECDCEHPSATGKPGVRGPRGPPGKDAVVDPKSLEKLKGDPGDRGLKGDKGVKGQPGRTGINGSCVQQCNREAIQLSTTYTRWGRSSCPSKTNASVVYEGYMGGAYHNHEGGGSNYLCLPRNPKYGKYDEVANSDNRASIYGVEFELGDSELFETSVKTGQYFNAMCSVCEVKERSKSLMVPGTTDCPAGWVKEYQGFLMAQQTYVQRTQYICVDRKPDLLMSTKKWDKGAFLHFVETKCGALPCNHGTYRKDYELSCVVCTSS